MSSSRREPSDDGVVANSRSWHHPRGGDDGPATECWLIWELCRRIAPAAYLCRRTRGRARCANGSDVRSGGGGADVHCGSAPPTAPVFELRIGVSRRGGAELLRMRDEMGRLFDGSSQQPIALGASPLDMIILAFALWFHRWVKIAEGRTIWPGRRHVTTGCAAILQWPSCLTLSARRSSPLRQRSAPASCALVADVAVPWAPNVADARGARCAESGVVCVRTCPRSRGSGRAGAGPARVVAFGRLEFWVNNAGMVSGAGIATSTTSSVCSMG